MPTYVDYSLAKYEDGVLTLELQPPVAVGGWTLRYTETKRFGGLSGSVYKWAASGFNNVSGINVVNSGQGIMKITINSPDSSGRDFGNYAFVVERVDSGHRTVLAEGYHKMGP